MKRITIHTCHEIVLVMRKNKLVRLKRNQYQIEKDKKRQRDYEMNWLIILKNQTNNKRNNYVKNYLYVTSSLVQNVGYILVVMKFAPCVTVD